jgi:hypothetical protein
MKITLEQIDELRKRSNVGYKEAKEALEKYDGDLVEALASLDEEKKIKSGSITGNDIYGTCKNIVSRGNKIKLKITKNDNTIINLPLTLVIIIGIITIPLFIGSMILAVFTGCKIRFVKENGEDCSINKHIEKAAIIVNETAQKVTEDIKNA